MSAVLDLLYPGVIVAITLIICLRKLHMDRKDAMFIFLLCILCVYIVSARLIRHLYYSCIICLMVTLSVFIILLSKLDMRIKITLAMLIIGIYFKTLYLVFMIIYLAIRSILSKSKSDIKLRNHVERLYSNCGLKIVSNFNKMSSKPTILLANYCRDRVENSACMLIPRKLAIMMQIGFKHVNMSGIINKPIFTSGKKGNFDNITKQIKLAHEEGNDIFVYINSPSYFDYMTRYKSGIFHIAKILHITITPLAIDYIDMHSGIINNQNFCIKVGKPFYVTNVNRARYRLRQFHQKYHRIFKRVKFDRNRITI